jgi:hypothetical protein
MIVSVATLNGREPFLDSRLIGISEAYWAWRDKLPGGQGTLEERRQLRINMSSSSAILAVGRVDETDLRYGLHAIHDTLEEP